MKQESLEKNTNDSNHHTTLSFIVFFRRFRQVDPPREVLTKCKPTSQDLPPGEETAFWG